MSSSIEFVLNVVVCFPVSTCFGSQSFAVAALTIWNTTTPLVIHSSVSIHCFRCKLLIFFYNLTLWSP